MVPVFLGADLNCYSFARAFYEKYGVSSYAFGKCALGAVKHSKFIVFTGISDISLYETLISFAESRKGKLLFLFGCTDFYSEFITENRETLGEYYFCPCPGQAVAKAVVTKAGFYSECDKYGLEYPKTKIIDRPSQTADVLLNLPFDYPVIIKPSYSAKYWEHPFEDMRKVYLSYDLREAYDTVIRIFSSGYNDKIIIQEFIPGDDTGMRVVTCYSDSDGKVLMCCAGHVLLEEHTPKGRGNPTAILTCRIPELQEPIIRFLEKTGYTGFSNFDAKYDERDGRYKIFEINLRQGRSNYYVTAAGCNIASYPVNEKLGAIPRKAPDFGNEIFWHSVPKDIVYGNTDDEALVLQMKKCVKEHKAASPLVYDYDLYKNPRRGLYIAAHQMKFYLKYAMK